MRQSQTKQSTHFLLARLVPETPMHRALVIWVLPPCDLNLQTQISCYNHFLTSHMEHETKKVNCIKCIQKKSSGEQVFPVGVTLQKEEVDTSVQRGLIPTDHVSLWKQEQNRESACTEP